MISTLKNRILESHALSNNLRYISSWSRFLIFSSLLLAQVVALASMLWTNSLTIERALEAKSQSSLNQLTLLTTNATNAYLDSAADIVKMNKKLIEGGQIAVGSPQQNLRSMAAIVKTVPSVDAAMLGEPDGSFALARRDSKHQIFKRIVVLNDTGPKKVDTTARMDGKVLKRQGSLSDYDPRLRPWYTEAIKANGRIIQTKPYVFASSGEPGITLAALVKPKVGRRVVFAADIKLTALSQMLKKIHLTKNGHTFLIDMEGNALASSQNWPSTSQKVPQIRDFNDQVMSDLIQYYRDSEYITGDQEHWHKFVSGGENYVALIKSFYIQSGQKWLLCVYAPQAAFMGQLYTLHQRQTLAIFIIVILSNLLTWPLVIRATRSISGLQRQSTMDGLTGLYNRAGFLAGLQQEMQISVNRGHFLGLVMIDLDGFKRINDNFGHGAGDQLLVNVAKALQKSLRDDDVLGRLGGDEFALVMRGTDHDAMITRVRDIIEQAQARPLSMGKGDKRHYVGITAGVAFLSSPHQSSNDLLEQADQCLIAGKKLRKGRVWTAEELIFVNEPSQRGAKTTTQTAH